MPFAQRPDAQIWWDQDGTGDPVLLIMGHAYGADMWRIPTLVMHGAQDRIVPAINAQRLADRIAGTRLVVLPDAGHVERPGEETPAGSRLNDLDSQVLALATTWITAEEAPASGLPAIRR